MSKEYRERFKNCSYRQETVVSFDDAKLIIPLDPNIDINKLIGKTSMYECTSPKNVMGKCNSKCPEINIK